MLLMNYENNNMSKKTYDSIFNQIESDHKTKKNVNINSKILLIDGLNTFIRAFSANPAVNDDGSHTLVEDPANLNYDEGRDAVPVKRRTPIQQKGPSVPTVEPEKTGMAALLAKRRKPTDRLELADDVSGQAKFRNIYGRNYRTV